MSFGFVTDATCDLDINYLEKSNVDIIPIKVMHKDRLYLDQKNTEKTKVVYELLKNNNKDLSTEPSKTNEIKSFLVKNTVLKNDRMICIMPMSAKTESYQNTLAATSKIILEARQIRTEKGIKGSLIMDVIDSQQISTGLGLIIMEAINLQNKGADADNIIKKIKHFSSDVQTFLIPNNLGQLYNQAAKKGDKSIGFASYWLGSALDIKPIVFAYKGKIEPVAKVKGFDSGLEKLINMIIFHINSNNLISRNVCYTYAGDLEELESKPIFIKLKAVAQEKNISLNASKMSAAMVTNLGLGAFIISFASPKVDMTNIN